MTVSTLAPVRKSVTVNVSQAKAFEVFTARFGDWWPLATHHTADVDAAGAVMEPRAGGRWFERGVDGTETMWGYVSVWEPPGRLVLAWHLDSTFHFDPDNASEVEVRFVTEDANRTRVELEHRNLDVYGDATATLRTAIDGEGGWGAILQEFVRLAG
jgi:hypothetical protein